MNSLSLSLSLSLFFYPGRARLMFTYVLGRYVAITVLLVPKLQALVYDILPLEEGAGKRCSEYGWYPNLSEGPDSVGGQLRGDK